MNNKDFEQLKEYLKEHLCISVLPGEMTDPNRRTIVLTLNGEQIDSASFDVASRREYEG